MNSSTTSTMKKIIISIICLNLYFGFSQQTPAEDQNKTIAIVGGTTHVGNGNTIENSAIIFKDGKITLVADMATIRIDMRDMQVIDAGGKHIYPGFIVPNSTLGLVEIDAVRASDDEREIGTMNPHIRSIIAYNAESKVVESMRPNGVLMGQITPRGGRISGTSSIVQFDAWNWEDALIKENDGIHINWPNTFVRGRWGMGESDDLKPNKSYSKQVEALNQFIISAKAHNTKPTSSHLPFEAMKLVIDKSSRLFFHVNDEKGIRDVIHFAKKHDLGSVTIVGAAESHLVKEVLKKNNISVLLRRVHSLPVNEDDSVDLPFVTAKILDDAGVLVGLETSGDMERMNSRNLPFYAGTVAAHGVDKENALRMITLNTAKILGIDKTYGSIETGKQATLFISDGDALDMRTNKVSHAFIDGRQISLKTHQTQLWKKYSNKFKAKK